MPILKAPKEYDAQVFDRILGDLQKTLNALAVQNRLKSLKSISSDSAALLGIGEIGYKVDKDQTDRRRSDYAAVRQWIIPNNPI